MPTYVYTVIKTLCIYYIYFTYMYICLNVCMMAFHHPCVILVYMYTLLYVSYIWIYMYVICCICVYMMGCPSSMCYTCIYYTYECYTYVYMYELCICIYDGVPIIPALYGVATIRRLLKIIGFFCKRAL